MKNLFVIFVVILCSCTNIFAKTTKALIISGQNNHNWKVSHLMLKDILDKENYKVDIALSPEKGGDMTTLNPNFSKYDVVILDYNGDRWCKEMEENFVKYTKSGKIGVVIFHAANNAFADWDEFNKIIALGGWGGRGKDTEGYYVEWKDNQLVKYEASDKVGNHGSRHDFKITCRTPNHPITKGLPATMVQAEDELYDFMKGEANIKDVLYTAYSDPAKGGTGKEEILVFTVDYHDARIFHTMLGHVSNTPEESKPISCDTFVKTFVAGTAWAAERK